MRDKILVFSIILALFLFLNLHGKTLKICIFDTSNLEQYRIQNFIDIAQSVGYKIDYKSFAKILDSDIDQLHLSRYDGVFFIIGIEFLQGMAKSVASHKILQIICLCGQNSNKLLGFFLPPIRGVKLENKAGIFAPIFARFGLSTSTIPFKLITSPENDLSKVNIKTTQNGLKYFSQATKYFLDKPLEARGSLYHTTLSSPKEVICSLPKLGFSSISTVLPIKQHSSEKIHPTFPYGIYFFDPLRKNHIFVSGSSMLTFSGISENFHLCPVSFALRRQIHENIQETMWELSKIVLQKNTKNFCIDFKSLEKDKKPTLPKKLAAIGGQLDKKKSNKFLKKTAWMDIGLFEENNDSKITQEEKIKREDQKKFLIESILKCGDDLHLWITLNPHMYFSPIAKRADKIEIFWKSVSDFTSKLKTKAQEFGVKTPKILIGFEMVNNIYAPNLPKESAEDLYENRYFDVPAPLDQNFWKNEIKKPLRTFLMRWENPEVNHGISISGVILDLEMYCRRTTGAFLATMGFEQETFKKFVQEEENQNIFYLLKAKKLQTYFTFLEDQAEKLGQNLRKYFDKKIPNGTIACYAPNISIDWFYKGFYKGLGTKSKPVQILTFNSEFKSHQKWLEKNKIFADHSSVLMLSKIKGQPDFWWINRILEHNHGIWFNKFSRFAEEQHKSWMDIEQSPMSREDQLKFFEFLRQN